MPPARLPPVRSVVTVSIDSLFPPNQHSCVIGCIFQCYQICLPDALSCAYPVANDCFCATASASASVATSWIAACGSSRCAACDLSDDLTSMHSIYASYCLGAGYTQPGVTDWYNPTTATANPGNTATSGPASTTTQQTVVTQNAPSIGGSAATQPQGKFLLSLATVPLILLQVPLPAPRLPHSLSI